ncbi:shikimate dehydrogenase [Hellea balneolensis]|uniref:shikimate dehydrogenase n=1 Tax=Hellea balneolensis TaxID=287478 RepID=UPI0004284E62|nr:shikimate dehydrogenase [Hellea balneolensis]
MSKITTLAGVCGWPIHHSLSPVLHNFWLKELGLGGAYVHFAVRPDEAVRAFKSLKRTSISGVNVTLPLKSLAYEAADEQTPDAIKLGVSNCLYKKDGKLIAHNTDLEGFAVPLIKAMGAKTLSQTPALIIGTGGAARAVIGALLALNVPEIRIIGRTDIKAEALVDIVNVPSFYALPWAKRDEAVAASGLIINATAGGMSGKPELDIDIHLAEKGSFVYDLIYTPRHTRLLREAKKAGCMTLGGLEMLIAQARPSFRLFYGHKAPELPDPKEMLFAALKAGQ